MNKIDYYGMQSIRLNINDTHINVPNLYGIASNIMFQPSIVCPPQFQNITHPQGAINPYTSFCSYIQNIPLSRKVGIKHQCTINKNKQISDLFIFRNDDEQGSKITFFEQQRIIRIKFYRIEAAAYMNSNRFCMIIIKNGIQKLIIVERIDNQLDILCEYDIKLNFQFVDIRYVQSEHDRKYILVFSGELNKPYQILVFEYNKKLQFVLKKSMNYSQQRLFPVIYQHSNEYQTYFYVIGGKKNVGSNKYQIEYQSFKLQDLFSSESNLLSEINQIQQIDLQIFDKQLYGGVVNNNYLVIPNSNIIYSLNVLSNNKLSIFNSYFVKQDEQVKHKRYLSNEILINNNNGEQIQYIHVCIQDNQRYIKKEIINKTYQIQNKYCKLF